MRTEELDLEWLPDCKQLEQRTDGVRQRPQPRHHELAEAIVDRQRSAPTPDATMFDETAAAPSGQDDLPQEQRVAVAPPPDPSRRRDLDRAAEGPLEEVTPLEVQRPSQRPVRSNTPVTERGL